MRTIQGADGSAPRRNCGRVNDLGGRSDRPATDLRSDILSPCAGNSILASQAPQRDRRDVTTNCRAPDWRYRQGRMAAALLIATSALSAVPALASDAAATAREAIIVEGNRRVEGDNVRSYFPALPGH